ncbi:hypothetical protein IWW38_001506 [Coemansia aciculifera]|uniref:Uncharacterized protein n=1 Tax=Coemansia aciculifera TaxID=417176 RepID=A0ACC1M650_9FUNG|nr:hypothetical protein IWW38_001506 [Coemansia aciculifera]
MENNDNDDVWDESIDDLQSERIIADQSVRKIERAFINSGYKYGVDASKPDHMQEGFDQGFDLALQYGREIGTVLGQLLAQRSIRKKLDLPEVLNIDALVMRLRAITHKSIFQPEYLAKHQTKPEEELPSDTFTSLLDEANAALASLQIYI